MTKIIKLTGRYDSTRNSIVELIRTLTEQMGNIDNLSEYEVLDFDLNEVDYIDSNISVILYAFIKYIDYNNDILIGIIPPRDFKVREVLMKNNFCSLWKQDKQEDNNSTYIIIKESKNMKDCVDYTTKELSPKFDALKMNIYDKNAFFQALFEINNNSFQHGRCDRLYMCGQFFPNNHSLNLTYINFGKTFKQNFIAYTKTTNTDVKNDKPIMWSIKDGNSTDELSAGVGLVTFFDSIRKYNAEVVIFSDNEILEYRDNNFKDKYINAKFKGTIISIKFKLNESNCIK